MPFPVAADDPDRARGLSAVPVRHADFVSAFGAIGDEVSGPAETLPFWPVQKRGWVSPTIMSAGADRGSDSFFAPDTLNPHGCPPPVFGSFVLCLVASRLMRSLSSPPPTDAGLCRDDHRERQPDYRAVAVTQADLGTIGVRNRRAACWRPTASSRRSARLSASPWAFFGGRLITHSRVPTWLKPRAPARASSGMFCGRTPAERRRQVTCRLPAGNVAHSVRPPARAKNSQKERQNEHSALRPGPHFQAVVTDTTAYRLGYGGRRPFGRCRRPDEADPGRYDSYLAKGRHPTRSKLLTANVCLKGHRRFRRSRGLVGKVRKRVSAGARHRRSLACRPSKRLGRDHGHRSALSFIRQSGAP